MKQLEHCYAIAIYPLSVRQTTASIPPLPCAFDPQRFPNVIIALGWRFWQWPAGGLAVHLSTRPTAMQIKQDQSLLRSMRIIAVSLRITCGSLEAYKQTFADVLPLGTASAAAHNEKAP